MVFRMHQPALGGATRSAAATATWWSSPAPEAARVRRMLLLFVAIGLMSATDLALTLTYMRGPGMFEVNPIARPLVEGGATLPLVLYKILTVSIACIAMFMVRRHRRAELCAWVCTAVLMALTMHWVRYNDFIALLNSDMSAVTCQADVPTWLHISE